MDTANQDEMFPNFFGKVIALSVAPLDLLKYGSNLQILMDWKVTFTNDVAPVRPP